MQDKKADLTFLSYVFFEEKDFSQNCSKECLMAFLLA